MWFVAIGVLTLLLKLLDVAPVAQWSWLLVLAPSRMAPLGLAAAPTARRSIYR